MASITQQNYPSHLSADMNAQEEVDYSKLPLEERLSHKVWKARLDGYQELKQILSSNPSIKDNKISIYWRDPSLFNKFITDSNVAAQEHALVAFESLIIAFTPLASAKHVSTSLLPIWIPSLIEKGITSTRAATKNKSLDCILLLCSLDNSITQCIECILPFFDKKLPKLLAGSLQTISDLIISYGMVNVHLNSLLPQILKPLPKLASHADKNVRAETMNLIVHLYNVTGQNKEILQELLLDQLKPIQQRDLDKLFEKQQDQATIKPARLFEWQRKELEKQKEAETMASAVAIDQDGDTDMDLNVKPLSTSNNKSTLDPFAMLPEETVLDKLPEEFNEKIVSAKWKDRVEVLEEFHDFTLTKIKKLKSKNQDYSHLLQIFGHIIQKDANVQAVTIAAQSVEIICAKLRTSGFHKHYVSIVFVPLLERTKERKPSVIEAIRKALRTICQFHNPLKLA